ncbi:MAG TPA: tetratricopeptide repeat protein [Candidatus Nitrosotenuis sp.]|nr:tetratricopeptide repeat protein [Candidatus Nitrosotenuis sp.]
MSLEHKALYEFGPFRLDPAERRLTCHTEPVSLAPKTFDLLLVLVENAGHLLAKDELLKRLWPDTFVEEATLAKHISTLRKALGDSPQGTEFIETVPKAGYRFVAKVAASDHSAGSRPDLAAETETAAVREAAPAGEERRTGWLDALSAGWRKLRPAHRNALAIAACAVLLPVAYIGWQPARAPAANPQAYELYLKGRHFWSKRTADSLPKARGYFAQSIALDPDFAPAHAGLAETCVADSNPAECEKAEAHARKALELDESRPEAHVALGVLLMQRFAWAEADRELRRALELDPRHGNAHFWRSAWLLAQGRMDEAIAAAQRARELDPLSALSYHQLGVAYYLARRYDRAVEQFQRALELEPESLWTHLRLAQAYGFLGKSAEFNQAAEQAARISPAGAARLAFGLAQRGETARAREILARELKNLSAKEANVDIAALFLALGEPDEALRQLEATAPRRTFDLWYLKVDPRFDALRGHPRFTQVLRTIGLEPRGT